MESMFVIYKITHDATGRYYIGKTTLGKWERGYMGQGTWIKRMVAKYGRDAFTREIISEHASEPEAYKAEREVIGLRFALDPLCINLKSGGLGGEFGQKVTPEALAKRGKLSEETKKKMSQAHKGRPSPMKGKKHTPETKAKISASLTGYKRSPENRRAMSKARIGRVVSPETRAKISKTLKEKYHDKS